MNPPGSTPAGGSAARVGMFVAAWLIVALVVGATGLLGRAPIPPPALALVLTAAVLALLWVAPGPRHAVRGLGPGPLVGVHLVRVIAGAYFLILYDRGALPGEFALAAGWGDIVVGLAALAVLWLCLPVRARWQRAGLLIWNTAGLIDILGVLGNGARLFARDPAFGEQFTTLPLALLPAAVVPIVIVSHVLVFVWIPRATLSTPAEAAAAAREPAVRA